MNFVSEGRKYLEVKTKQVNDLKKENEALKAFKERTGLKGQELKKAFEEYWNNGNPKGEIDNYIQMIRLENLKKLETNLLKNIKEEKEAKLRIKEREDRLSLLRKRLEEKNKKEPIKKISVKKEQKTYKESNIMKGRSDLKKKGDKYEVETELHINNDIDDKIKRALIKSIIEELNRNFDDYKFFYEKKN
jgi:hypothetical protein